MNVVCKTNCMVLLGIRKGKAHAPKKVIQKHENLRPKNNVSWCSNNFLSVLCAPFAPHSITMFSTCESYERHGVLLMSFLMLALITTSILLLHTICRHVYTKHRPIGHAILSAARFKTMKSVGNRKRSSRSAVTSRAQTPIPHFSSVTCRSRGRHVHLPSARLSRSLPPTSHSTRVSRHPSDALSSNCHSPIRSTTGRMNC